MEVLMAVVILIGLCLAGGLWGADSRPLDLDRPTRWLWPMGRRN